MSTNSMIINGVKVVSEGPEHLEPKKMMRPGVIDAKMTQILKGTDKDTKREQFIDSMYADFKNHMDQPTRITVSEFQKFEDLFSMKTRESYFNGTMTASDHARIHALSEEFYHRVNVQMPVFIIDDHTGELVREPLPPIFMALKNLHGAAGEAVQIFQNAHANDDLVKGGMSEVKKNKATANLAIVFAKAQNAEEILKYVDAFDTLAENFHTKELGKSIYASDEETSSETDQEDPTAVKDDDFIDSLF